MPAVFGKLATALTVAATVTNAGDPKQTDAGFELQIKSMEKEFARQCFPTKVATKGVYFVSGPSKFEATIDGKKVGDWKFQAVMDGFAHIYKFDYNPTDQPGKMCFSTKWMNTGYWRNFLADPTKQPRGVLFEDTMPNRPRCFYDMCDYKAPNDNNWVNMRVIGDDAVWFSDTPTGLTMNMDNMNVTGQKAWADDRKSFPTGQIGPEWVPDWHMVMGGSAHPIERPLSSDKPGSKEMVELASTSKVLSLKGLGLGGPHYVHVYTFDPSVKGLQKRKHIGSIKEDNLQYFHSFGVTPNYFVFINDIQQVGIGPGHKATMINAYQPAWNGIKVMDSQGNVQHFDDMDPIYHVHIANTYENSTGIVMDLSDYGKGGVPFPRPHVMDIAGALNKTVRDTAKPRGQMVRIHLNFQTKKSTRELLTNNNRDYDFLKINDQWNGRPYCIYYVLEWFHDDSSYASMAVMKHNTCTGVKSYWAEANVYPHEPYFVPNADNDGTDPAKEDDGVLYFGANDGNIGAAIQVAVDGKSFKEIERIQLPTHIPYSAHGEFVPAKAKAADEIIV